MSVTQDVSAVTPPKVVARKGGLPLARDLDIPISIVGCRTAREGDGLGLSSRNVRLSSIERQVAPRLASNLFEAEDELAPLWHHDQPARWCCHGNGLFGPATIDARV